MDKHEVTARDYFIKDPDEEKPFEIFMLTCREQGVSWCRASDTEKSRIEELTTYGDYLRKHNRELCHFALDLFFDTSVDVDLKLPPDVALQIVGDAADYGESPQRYFLRVFRSFIENLREQKSKARAVVQSQEEADGAK